MPRPKGSKNKATLLKEALSKDIHTTINGKINLNIEGVVDKVIAQALDGCKTSQKMILDRCDATAVRKAIEHKHTMDTQKWEFNVHVVQPNKTIEGRTYDADKINTVPIPRLEADGAKGQRPKNGTE